MQLRSDPTQALPSATFVQGKNADSPSSYKQVRVGVDARGNSYREETAVRMGVVRDLVVSMPPAAPWGQWGVAALGAVALIAGCVLLYNGWPKVGGSLAGGGALAMVVALTVAEYGWMYALGVMAISLFAVWTLYSGYKSGLAQPALLQNVAVPLTRAEPAI